MPNYSIALSGLKAATVSLNTIANNLANMSTTAYKTQTVSFTDAFYEALGTSGSGDAIAVGTGTTVASTSTDFTQGDYTTDGTSNTDMAINGSGFFVVESSSGSEYLTRDGSFTEDTDGHLETSSGYYLMGYSATNGTVDTSSLSEITLPTTGSTLSASASTEFTVTANLTSSAAVGDTYTSSVTLYDSLGTTHTATITYTKTAENSWDYFISLPDSDYSSGSSTAETGTLTFDSSGNLATINGQTVGTDSSDTSTLSLTFSGLADGASDLTVSWNLLSSSDATTVTQTSSSSSSSTSTDGYAAGTYESFTVDTDGTIEAHYSNSQTQVVGQVVLADVTNEQGLTSVGSNLYQVTTASGTATTGVAGTGTLGTVLDSELEESNVDISTQFADLIIAQRAFQADSKAIMAMDSITQSTIDIAQ
jgi:flagellar hook protein FlgE